MTQTPIGIRKSVEARIVAALGGVYGPYTGRWFVSPRDTDIEHIVARSEAHDSGLCAADAASQRRFASDLLNLTLSSPAVNRTHKNDKDAAEWLPDLNQCWFADRVVAVRRKFGLTIDPREAAALDRVLVGCRSTAMLVVPRPAASTQRPALVHESELARNDPHPEAPHLPISYDSGPPRSVIRFRMLHASSASALCPPGVRARRPVPMIDLYLKKAFSTRACRW